MQALVVTNGKMEYTTSHPEPEAGPDEVLIQVEMAGICATDVEILKGYMGFEGVPGHEFVGTVLKGPREVKGKRVVADINFVCGKCDMCHSGLSSHCRSRKVMGITGHDGAFAERMVVPRRNLHMLPDVVDNEVAIFAEPLAAAMQIARQVQLERRQKVIVVGDGRLGLLAVQVLAENSDAGRVVLLGKHPDKLAFCEKRGIQGATLDDMLVKPEWDVVVDCTGSPEGFNTACRLVRPRGKLVLKSTWVADEPVDLAPLVINEITLVGSRCGPLPEAINALAAGRVVVHGMITSRFRLSQFEQAFAKLKEPNQIKAVFEIK